MIFKDNLILIVCILLCFSSQLVNTGDPGGQSTELCENESSSQQTITLDQFKFSRTRSMRGPKGLRISKVNQQSRDSDNIAVLILSSEDEGKFNLKILLTICDTYMEKQTEGERKRTTYFVVTGKGNSDQSESPPPLPPRRHRSRPNTAMSSYTNAINTGHHTTATLDTNSISSEDSYPSIPCSISSDLHRLRVSSTSRDPPVVPPKSPLITRIEVTGEVHIRSDDLSSISHRRSRSELSAQLTADYQSNFLHSSTTRLPPVLKKNNRTKSSDNIVRKNLTSQTSTTTNKSDSNESVDEGNNFNLFVKHSFKILHIFHFFNI